MFHISIASQFAFRKITFVSEKLHVKLIFIHHVFHRESKTIHFQTELGNKYIVIKPDTGIFYPAANYFCNKVMKIIHRYDENNVPFIIDCERIRSIDYTAIKVADTIIIQFVRLITQDVRQRKFLSFFQIPGYRVNIGEHQCREEEIVVHERFFRDLQ